MVVMWASEFEEVAAFVGTTAVSEGGRASIESSEVVCIASGVSLQFRLSVISSMVGIQLKNFVY